MADFEVGDLILKVSTMVGDLEVIEKTTKTLNKTYNTLNKLSKLDFKQTEATFKQLSTAMLPFSNELKRISPEIVAFSETLKGLSTLKPFVNLTNGARVNKSELAKDREELSLIRANIRSIKTEINQTKKYDPFNVNKIQQYNSQLEKLNQRLKVVSGRGNLKGSQIMSAEIGLRQGGYSSKSVSTTSDMERLRMLRTEMREVRSDMIITKNTGIVDNKSLNAYTNRLVKIRDELGTIKANGKLNVSQIKNANLYLKQTQERLDAIASKNKSGLSKLFNLANVGKLYLAWNYGKRIGQAFGDMTTAAIDFQETVNKFQVAMGESYSEQLNFVNRLAEAYNLSTNSLMNYQATFKNMLSGLGQLTDETSAQVSQTVTRMALDYASLFNVSYDRSMSIFQSMLSGQIKAIRSVSGTDTAQQTLEQIWENIGGDTSYKKLGRTEKELLAILAVQKQMQQQGAFGDLQKTLGSTSNTLKQMQGTIQEIYRWMGSLTIGPVNNLLKGMLTALSIFKEILKSINLASGYQIPTVDDLSENPLAGLNDSLDGSIEKTKELQGLFSFDKFTALGSGGGGNALNATAQSAADIQKILENIQSYTSDFESSAQGVSKAVDSILRGLGYVKKETKDQNGAVTDTYYAIDKTNVGASILNNTMKATFGIAAGKMILFLAKKIKGLILPMKLFNLELKTSQRILSGLNSLLTVGLIASAIGLFDAIKDGNKQMIAIYGTATGVLGVTKAIILLKTGDRMEKLVGALKVVGSGFSKVGAIISMLSKRVYSLFVANTALIGSMALIGGSVALLVFMDKMNSTSKILVGTLWAVVGAIVAVKAATSVVGGATSIASIATALGGLSAIAAGTIVAGKGINEKIQGYATGGLPSTGEVYIARENGAQEFVGSFGNKGAVANNNQIVDGVAKGVAQVMANSQQSQEVKVVFDVKNANSNVIAKELAKAFKKAEIRKGVTNA